MEKYQPGTPVIDPETNVNRETDLRFREKLYHSGKEWFGRIRGRFGKNSQVADREFADLINETSTVDNPEVRVTADIAGAEEILYEASKSGEAPNTALALSEQPVDELATALKAFETGEGIEATAEVVSAIDIAGESGREDVELADRTSSEVPETETDWLKQDKNAFKEHYGLDIMDASDEHLEALEAATGEWGEGPSSMSEGLVIREERNRRREIKQAEQARQTAIEEASRIEAEYQEKAALEAIIEGYEGPGKAIREAAKTSEYLRGETILKSPNLVDKEDIIDLSPWKESSGELFGEDLEQSVKDAIERSPFESDSGSVEEAINGYFSENMLAAAVIEDILSGGIDQDSARWETIKNYKGANYTFLKIKEALVVSHPDNPDLARAEVLSHLLEANSELFAEESLPQLSVTDSIATTILAQRVRLSERLHMIAGADHKSRSLRQREIAYKYPVEGGLDRSISSYRFEDIEKELKKRRQQTIGDIRHYDSPLFHNTPYGDASVGYGSLVSSIKNAELHGGKRHGPNYNEHNLGHSLMPHWSEVPALPRSNDLDTIKQLPYRVDHNGRDKMVSPTTFMKTIGEVVTECPVSRGAVFSVVHLKSESQDIAAAIPKPWIEIDDEGIYQHNNFNYGDSHGLRASFDREFLPIDHTSSGFEAAQISISENDRVDIGDLTGKGYKDVSTPGMLRSTIEIIMRESSHKDEYVVPLRVSRKLLRSAEPEKRKDIHYSYKTLNGQSGFGFWKH